MDQTNTHAHERIAAHYMDLIDSGEISPGTRLPTNREMMELWDVAMGTVAQAMRNLKDAGYIHAVRGRGTEVLPPAVRTEVWQMTGRYARARSAAGLVFESDIESGNITKETVRVEWSTLDSPVLAELMGLDLGSPVLTRESRTYVDDRVTEMTTMHFPEHIANEVPDLEHSPDIRVVPLIEGTGRTITATTNRIDGRPPTRDERDLLRLAEGEWIFSHTHATLAGNEPVEGVINIKPQKGTSITFTTDERP